MNKFEQLLNIEEEFDLSNVVFNGEWIYPIIKQNLYVHTLSGNQSTLGLSKKSSLVKKFLQSFYWSSKNKSIDNIDFLIVDSSTSRRFNKDTNKYESLYTDYLHKLLSDYTTLTYERPGDSGVSHYKELPEVNIYYPDMLLLKALIKARLEKGQYNISKIPTIKKIMNYIGADDSFISFSSEKISRFFSLKSHYKKLLSKHKPRAVILINAYNYANMAFVAAAKELGVPTIELQHGFIRFDHPGYVYKKIYSKNLFPEYFFSYGNYFTNFLNENSVIFDKQKIITTGSYSTEKYLSQLKNADVSNSYRKKYIYITSQWAIRDKLKAFVLELSEKLPEKYDIVYKTHPLETDTQKFYEEFSEKANIHLIDNAQINSLDLMPGSLIHSTVYSTSFMEAHFLGKPNVFIYVKGYSQVIERFIDGKVLFIAKSPDEYLNQIELIEKNSSKIEEELARQKGLFYRQNAGENILHNIKKIINGGN